MKKVKNLKSFFATSLCVAMALTLFAGCSGSTTTTTTSSSTNTTSKSSAPVTITYAIWDVNQQPGMQAMADQFHKENPNITVKVQVTDWNDYWTKLNASASGGALPDTFWMHASNFIRFAQGGMLMDLTQKIASSTEVKDSNFPSALVTGCTYKGKQYGMPKDYDTIGLWYNKTLFDQKGIKYPDNTWTWSTLESAAKKLTDNSKGIYGFLAPEDVQEDIYDFIYQNGGAPINNDRTSSEYTSTATVQALQFYLNLAQVDKVSPMQSVFANTANDKLFCSGKAAMCLFGSWMTSEFYGNAYTKANCDVATIPQGITKATMYNGLGNVVSAQTKNPDASWKWVEYLGTKEANDIQSEYGSAIPAYNGCTAGWEKHFSCFNVSIYPAELPYAVLYPSNYDAYATFSTTEGDILTQACNGKLTAAQACSQLSTGMNKAIASTK